MAIRIRLAWTDTNTAESGHHIYRSDTPMDPNDLPAPIADLGPGVTEYLDEDVTENATYYYRVGAYTVFAEEVSAEVSATANLVPAIGEFWPAQGGYYAGLSSLGNHVIVAPKADEVTRQWKTANTDTPDSTDSLPWAKTALDYRAAAVAAGIAAHPAQQWCFGRITNGFTDWCLPGPDEATVINNNLNPNTTSAPLFQVGGAQQYRNTSTHASAADWWYWTARQDSSNVGRAIMHRPASPAGLATWPSKTETRPIRPIRIIPAS